MTAVDGGLPVAGDAPASLRVLGRLRVLQALADEPGISRPELVTRTGLARATVASVVTDLMDAGLVAESDAPGRTGRTGRPAQYLSLAAGAACAVGVDIGHDHVRTMVCDLHGVPLREQSVDMAVDDAPAAVLTAVGRQLRTLLRSRSPRDQHVLGVGLGLASPVDHRTGTLRAEGIMPGWIHTRPADVLTERLGVPVRLINDANAGVLAERRYGAARSCDDVIYVRLSAGIGAGIVSDGRMLLGASGLAGEVGHVTVDPGGAVCRCGNRGCLETVASPVAIADLLSRGSAPVSPAQVVDLVQAGDLRAVRAVQDAGDAVGRALAGAIMIVNPRLIVVGGELAAAGEVLFAAMRRSIQRDAMASHTADLTIVRSELGDAAGVRGAAAFALAAAPEQLAALAVAR